MQLSKCRMHIIFLRNCRAPLKVNNDGYIELLYRYKQAKTSRITVLNIRKLYLYFVYFKLYVYFECSPAVPLKSDMCATPTCRMLSINALHWL